jgi:nicotinate-nucleotide pyrophosphorylase (carboxylating)
MMVLATSPWQLNQLDQQLIDIALAEDLGLPHQDLTTMTLFPDMSHNTAHVEIISKQPESIILCGLPIARRILARLDERCEVKSVYFDGDTITTHATILTITGPAQALLMAERVMLNFLQHLSAIATLTHRYVNQVRHTKTSILDTRKTLPGFRHLDKYAVYCGGGVNHRMGLYDAIMIKDTHVDLLGGIEKALNKLPENITVRHPVIVEVRSQQELLIVLEKGLHKVTRVLLDNMSLAEMRACVTMCKGYLPTEASGNIHLDNVAAIAETGVDFISIGKLTHSAGNVDLSMRSDNA